MLGRGAGLPERTDPDSGVLVRRVATLSAPHEAIDVVHIAAVVRTIASGSTRSRPQASLGSRTGSLIARRLDSFRLGEEMTMAQSKEPATNERVVRLLEEIKEQLADVSKRQEEMAHDLTRLLKHA